MPSMEPVRYCRLRKWSRTARTAHNRRYRGRRPRPGRDLSLCAPGAGRVGPAGPVRERHLAIAGSYSSSK
jgi:hypothetical protein